MVEVFKTNVTTLQDAERLLSLIHKTFVGYKANFDLHDCDNILRIKAISGTIVPDGIVSMLDEHGFEADVLPDEINVLAQ
ncbi:MAG: hypothetical protein ABIN67_17425 [Ferruginibacter sp.]